MFEILNRFKIVKFENNGPYRDEPDRSNTYTNEKKNVKNGLKVEDNPLHLNSTEAGVTLRLLPDDFSSKPSKYFFPSPTQASWG